MWVGFLDVAPHRLDELQAHLDREEQARAQRFHFEQDRRRWITARGVLRVLLGGYLSRAPGAVSFALGPHEKPYLSDGKLWFNLSHSGPWLMLGVSSVAELGVDIERSDPTFSGQRIPERFFSPAEVQTLRALPAELQPRAFLACWTRKEAFIKARGDGLSLALDSFDVTLSPGDAPALTRTAWSPDEPRQWTLADLSDPGGRYLGALASRSSGWRVRLRRMEETLWPDG